MRSLEEVAGEVLTREKDCFDDSRGIRTPLPHLEVEPGRAHYLQENEYKIVIGSDGFQNPDGARGSWTEDNLSIFFENSLTSLYERAALDIIQEIGADLLYKYGQASVVHEPDIEINGIEFEDRETEGAFNKYGNVVKLDHSMMGELNPKSLNIGDRFEFISTHEAVHALWYNTNPHYKQLIDESIVGKTDSYNADVRRAPEEAITAYEGHKEFPDQIPDFQRRAMDAVRNPWNLPELNVSPEGYYSNNPYELGAMAAVALEEKIKATGRSKQEALNNTRRTLLETSSPQNLQNYIDLSLKQRELENYPQMFQEYISTLSEAEDTDEFFRTEVERITQDNAEELPAFLTSRALKDAYQTVKS